MFMNAKSRISRLRPLSLSTAVLAVSLSACAATTASEPVSGGALEQVARFEHQVTGVTVSAGGRIFVNFPRWTADTEVSVAELVNGQPVPYPDTGWNAWRNAKKDEIKPQDHWVCVQSVVAAGDSLWVLDPAAPAGSGEAVSGAVAGHPSTGCGKTRYVMASPGRTRRGW